MASKRVDPSIKNYTGIKVTENDSEKVLGEKIFDYEQRHIAIAYQGRSKNYKEEATLLLAEKARREGYKLVGDIDYCPREDDSKRVIVAGTGFKKKGKLEKTVDSEIDSKKYSKTNISHINANEFLRRMGDNADNYERHDINISYRGKTGEDYLSVAERALAEKAISQGFRYVTEMDYVAHDPKRRTVKIEAKALKPINIIITILFISGIFFLAVNNRITGNVIGFMNSTNENFSMYVGVTLLFEFFLIKGASLLFGKTTKRKLMK